jgi:hypothetical protein
MSDDNEMELDDDELESLHEGMESDLDPEDVFKMVLINKIRKKRTHVELQDASGDQVQLKDVITELLAYIKEKLQDEDGNQFTEQIMPLMAQGVVSGLGRMVGIHNTAFMLANDTTRYSLINMMCVSFLLLKFVQQKGLVIHTYEEDVSDEEIAAVERKSEANKTATLAALAGEDPRAVLREMKERGLITETDLTDILKDNGDKDATETDTDDGKPNKSGSGKDK